MSKLKKDILTPEEEAAGFNPGEPDDDIFSLKDEDDYPGEFPAEQEDNAAQEEMQEISENEPGAAWAEFESAEAKQTGTEKQYDNQIDSEAEKSADSAKVGFDLEQEDELQSDKSELEPDDENLTSEFESIEADEDLKNMLKGELDRSEKRKRKNELIEKEEKELARKAAENHKEVPFKEIDKIKDSNAIDLAMIEADRPSQMFDKDTDSVAQSEDEFPKQEPESTIKNESTESDAKDTKTNSKAEKEKKKKAAFPLVAVLATAIITMLLTGGGFILYDKYFANESSSEEIALTDLHLEENKIIIKEDKSNDREIDSKADISEEKEPEQVADDSELEQSNTKAETQKTPNSSEEIIKPIEIAEVKTPVKKVPPSKPAETYEKVKPDSYSPKKPNEQKKSIANDKAADKVAISKPKAVDETQATDNSLIKQEAIAETFISSNEGTTRNKIKDEIGLYKVQVYSSLSREDAEDWKKRLENMNIDKVEISTHTIRDKIWYRVRFGEFSTREEARTVASLYGFSQTWIDRIK